MWWAEPEGEGGVPEEKSFWAGADLVGAPRGYKKRKSKSIRGGCRKSLPGGGGQIVNQERLLGVLKKRTGG